MLKFIAAILLASSIAAPGAMADPQRPKKLDVKAERIDNRLDRLERRGHIEQGSRLDHVEDRIDRREDRLDRRENRRDEAIDLGPRDVIEDKLDRLEDRQDRRESRRDRRAG